MTHPIPTKALAQHIAVLGKTGSGKTWAIRSAVEALLDKKERVCIIDPTGAWWGLKSSASGKRGGYPIVIFGGEHADLPLGSAHGEAIAEAIGTTSTPAILDTSLMKVKERTAFASDFFDAIMRKNKGPLHLVIDEAHVFMPQGKVPSPQAGEMLAAANNAVSGGRSRGLRITMITQRPAKLHKDSLTQAETLIAMRLIAPQDRAAVEAWIADNADEDKAQQIVGSLAELETGQGWIWAPQLKLLEKVRFPKISTFDSSRAPDSYRSKSVKVLAPIDIDAISERLQAVSAAALADDPKRLRAKITELERQLKTKVVPAKPIHVDLKGAEQRGYQWGVQAAFRAVKSLETRKMGRLVEVEDVKPQALRAVRETVGHAVVVPKKGYDKSSAARWDGNGRLPIGETAILTACIQFPDGLERSQLTVLTGYKRSSRDAYISRLREKALVKYEGSKIVATNEGIDTLPDIAPLPTGLDLQKYWLDKLPVGEASILKVLIERYPAAVNREALSAATDYQRSSRDAYLSRLAAKELIETSRGEVTASETLFGET